MKAKIDSPLFLQVVMGLKYLQEQGIVHRDIKPTNLLLNANGQIKICDFGISGPLDPTAPDFEKRQGTSRYLAPETDSHSIQGDMWALGMSLFEIANGEHPMIEENPDSVCSKIMDWEPPVLDNLSVEVNDLISKL